MMPNWYKQVQIVEKQKLTPVFLLPFSKYYKI
jgi:hypothetical protein